MRPRTMTPYEKGRERHVRKISPQELLGYESERGDGKLGSSGK